jgi:hypothetical protein
MKHSLFRPTSTKRVARRVYDSNLQLAIKKLALIKILTTIEYKVMKTNLALSLTLRRRALLVPCVALTFGLNLASAQQTANYAPPAGYQQQPGYGGYQAQRPGVGERVGGFVKRLFYGEPRNGYPQPQYTRPAQPGRSLDAPPSAYRSSASAPQSSRIASAPPSSQSQSKPAPSTKPTTVTKPSPGPAKTSSSKYTPPRIKPEASVAKPQPKPEPKKVQEQPPAPTTLAPRTEPKTTTYPSQPDNPPALNNKPSEAPTTLAGLTSTRPGSDAAPSTPTPPIQETQTTPKETPATNPSAGQFLVGKKTATAGRVISPYPPHQELDVSGLSSGSLALDPTTDKVFQIP